MKSSSPLVSMVALACALGCGGDDPGGGPGDPVVGEPAALVGITDAHNALRADVGVAPLVWNEDLEALAAGFIADCAFEHSSSAERSDVAGFAYVGENLYWQRPSPPTGPAVSDAWGSELAAYDYDSNTCSDVCGHYTQQVWAATTDIGCAIQACAGDSEYIVACNYGPGGNYVGQRPY